ncbi:MAG: hypothetical protein ABI584_10355 [Acidobacteriota bacterium]
MTRLFVGALLIPGAATQVAHADETCGPLFMVEQKVNANVVVSASARHSRPR